jgi:hypothetical protein
MQHAPSVRTLGLFLVLGLSGPMEGCGPAGTEQVPTTHSEEVDKIHKERYLKPATVQKNVVRKGSGRRSGP